VAQTHPEIVYHLAALSQVGRSWEDPATTLDGNVIGGVNLLEAVRKHAPRARVIWVSSCEVYGIPSDLPITEKAPVAPRSPYAVSKAAGEMLTDVYAQVYSLDIVRARPFNHAGPGQDSAFIVSSVARQAAMAIVQGAEAVKIVTGNPDTRRDFTDVRDVVRAYRLLASPDVHPDVFNISSGRSVSASEHVATVASLIAPIAVEHVVDPALVRANDVADSRGSHERLTAATGWRPDIHVDQMVADTIAWWQTQLAGA
jgi:GDP-4-dehydro-6-deoxy-D-mannose reductase